MISSKYNHFSSTRISKVFVSNLFISMHSLSGYLSFIDEQNTKTQRRENIVTMTIISPFMKLPHYLAVVFIHNVFRYILVLTPIMYIEFQYKVVLLPVLHITQG